MQKLRFRLFVTPIGAFFIVLVFVILIRSLLARNSYEIALSSAVLFLLLILGIIGAWKVRRLVLLEIGWKSPFPMTANADEEWVISGFKTQIPLFFRLHFIARGRFFPAGIAGSGSGCRVFAETSASRGEETAKLQLDFPMSGIFRGNGFCRLRDIFGFYSFFCGIPQQLNVKVRSAPCFGKKIFINAQSGAEDKRNKISSDEERYYMREYTPGDRLRDINWKSSEKIDALITRISPDNQEKVNRIEIYFRNFGPTVKPSLEALWLLDRAKARLSYFLRSLMEEQSSYVFHVRTASSGRSNWVIEDSEDLEQFLEELAGLTFSVPQNETVPAGAAASANAGELYVFSTACDFTLPGFLLACNPRSVSLFLVQSTLSVKGMEHKKKSALSAAGVNMTEKNGVWVKETETEILRKREFPAKGCFPLPRWLFNNKIKPLGVHAGRIDLIYAETRL